MKKMLLLRRIAHQIIYSLANRGGRHNFQQIRHHALVETSDAIQRYGLLKAVHEAAVGNGARHPTRLLVEKEREKESRNNMNTFMK